MTFTATGLTGGWYYIFEFRAINRIGYSQFSTQTRIASASFPSPPSTVSNIPSLTNQS